jgi:hypothetical protein
VGHKLLAEVRRGVATWHTVKYYGEAESTPLCMVDGRQRETAPHDVSDMISRTEYEPWHLSSQLSRRRGNAKRMLRRVGCSSACCD